MYVGVGYSYYSSIIILVNINGNDKNVIVNLVKNSVGKMCLYYSKLDFLNLLGFNGCLVEMILMTERTNP